MNVHNATCSCSVELYKQWYIFGGFFPKLEFSRGFLYISFAVYLCTITQCVFNMHDCNTVNSLNIKREE
jgi:hypothetical protein